MKKFTLTEILIGLGVFMLLFGGLFIFMRRSTQDSARLTEKIELQENLRIGMLKLEKLIRNSVEIIGNPPEYSLVRYGDDPVKTTSVAIITGTNEEKIISYNAAEGKLIVKSPYSGAPDEPIFTDIADFSFSVRANYLCDYMLRMKDSDKNLKTIYCSLFLDNNHVFMIREKGPLLGNVAPDAVFQNKLKHMNASFVASVDPGIAGGTINFRIPAWAESLKGKIKFSIHPFGSNPACAALMFYDSATPPAANPHSTGTSENEETFSSDPHSLFIETRGSVFDAWGRLMSNSKTDSVNIRNINFSSKIDVLIEWDLAESSQMKVKFNSEEDTKAVSGYTPSGDEMVFSINGTECIIRDFSATFGVFPSDLR